MVRVLICLELVLNSVNIDFVIFFDIFDNHRLRGDIFSIFVITVAVAEAAIGPAIKKHHNYCAKRLKNDNEANIRYQNFEVLDSNSIKM